MNNTYITQTETIVEALNIIDGFEEQMGLFKSKYPKYNYAISLRCSQGSNSDDDRWNIEFHISNEE